MNNIAKAAVKISGFKNILNPVRSSLISAGAGSQKRFVRNMWYMCNSRNDERFEYARKVAKPSTHLCSCGCGISGAHTKGENELVKFLSEEIVAERQAQKGKRIPTEVDGFKVSLNGAEITLLKESGEEKIKIHFSVNHTVDTDVEPDVDVTAESQDLGELKSKPAFKVDITRGNTTLSLLCSFLGPSDQDNEYDDIYGIDEIGVYEGEWNEKVYAVAGEVIDANLYDLLLNYLEEKGISNEFVDKLAELSTGYEHAAYVSLLEGLSKFVSGK